MSSAQSAQVVAIVAVVALAMAGVLFCKLMEEVAPPQDPPVPPGIRSRKSKPAVKPLPPRREIKPLAPYANRPDPKMEELVTLLQGDRAAAKRLAESAGGADIAIRKLLRDRM
jgi:hypothetical protein